MVADRRARFHTAATDRPHVSMIELNIRRGRSAHQSDVIRSRIKGRAAAAAAASDSLPLRRRTISDVPFSGGVDPLSFRACMEMRDGDPADSSSRPSRSKLRRKFPSASLRDISASDRQRGPVDLCIMPGVAFRAGFSTAP